MQTEMYAKGALIPLRRQRRERRRPQNLTKSWECQDDLNRLMSFSLDQGWRRRALDALDAGDGELVLDVATGTGDMALLAAASCRCRIVGIDLSRGMMASAARKWSEAKGDVEFAPVQGDASALPFKDGVFDRMMVAFGVRNMADVGSFLSEARRTLRTGGRMVVLELSVPELPVVRQTFLLYLTRVLPFAARLMGGDRAAYRYLADSIITFPPPARIGAMMEERGLRLISSEHLTLGSCHLHVVEKVSSN